MHAILCVVLVMDITKICFKTFQKNICNGHYKITRNGDYNEGRLCHGHYKNDSTTVCCPTLITKIIQQNVKCHFAVVWKILKNCWHTSRHNN